MQRTANVVYVEDKRPAFPYCRECLDKVKMKLLIQLNEVDKNCKKKGGKE